MSLKKICSRCNKIIGYGEQCSCYEKHKKERNREYDARYRKNDDIYKTGIWNKLTNTCKNKFNGIDIYSLYVKNELKYGKLSHHVIEIEEDKSRAYDIDNLIWLTDESHREVHTIYRKGEEKKRKLQEVLFDIIERYKSEYS